MLMEAPLSWFPAFLMGPHFSLRQCFAHFLLLLLRRSKKERGQSSSRNGHTTEVTHITSVHSPLA